MVSYRQAIWSSTTWPILIFYSSSLYSTWTSTLYYEPDTTLKLTRRSWKSVHASSAHIS
ncbi:hypothetical protein LZ32DRAFT_104279 [Colletotrichum eremochloae]|nr:hypothetical protein LZ32DRAFT_104279 [Colletotrichum eremochloae]